MEIRPLDREDPTELARYHAISVAAERFERPYAATWGLREMTVELTEDDPMERKDAVVAVDADTVVGAGIAWSSLTDNLHLSWLMPWVEPDRRRRGIGSAVLAELVALCRADRRTDLVMETSYPFERREDHPYRRFAEKNGFQLANTEIGRVRDLPVEDVDLDALVEEAAPHHAGYRVETFEDPLPDELLPSFCAAHNRLAVDAPGGDLTFEQEALTPELVRVHEDQRRRQGRRKITTVAMTEAGEVVGYNDLVVPDEDLPNVWQWGTLVVPAHRGHRLGLAMKARGLKELQGRVGPERTRVLTCNAEQNAPMVSINVRLGFRPVEVTPAFLLRVP
ncbi:GNAT family N-acetyltransferase [Pedococcus sp. 5OH_020]|uniref:GNAT family N-acetyltransferase n=1 Tax=Pedococcus sp. 5OH_020 TaxID=2989814 RepID=UPI0022E9B795|nr:GNAT family N-acetyltransferase [Pedococcus sp. 5OH_020]